MTTSSDRAVLAYISCSPRIGVPILDGSFGHRIERVFLGVAVENPNAKIVVLSANSRSGTTETLSEAVANVVVDATGTALEQETLMTYTATRPTGPVARFVAYDRTRIRSSRDDGTAAETRAETWVEEHSSIRIKSITPKSTGDFETVYIQLDASSAGKGMKHDFGASTEAGSPIAERMRAAYEADEPVYVAVETWRRRTREGTKDEIDPLTPIHVLRGATGDVDKGEPQATKANCRKVFAAVGAVDNPDDTVFATPKDLRSDPDEWEQLRGNRRGDIAPAGWACRMVDHKPIGGITVPSPATNVGTNELVVAFTDHLKTLGIVAPKSNQLMVSNGGPVGVRKVHAADDPPWQAVNTDGRPNPGGYLMHKIRVTKALAARLFDSAAATDADDIVNRDHSREDHIWGLTEGLLWISDKVQVQVLGGKVDRLATSHREAAEWVTHVIESSFPYTAKCVVSKEERLKWCIAVKDQAADDFGRAYKLTADYLEIDLRTVVDSNNSPSDPRPQNQKPQGPGPASDDHSGHPTRAIAPPPSTSARPESGADGDAEAVQLWKDLAAAIDVTDYSLLRPLLRRTFGVEIGMLHEIGATVFKQQAAQWSQNLDAFKAAAQSAYQADQGGTAQEKAG